MKNISISTLKALGLNETECRIYLTLIEYSPLNMAELARKSGIHRAEGYRAIPHLLELGLIGKAQKGARTYYRAESPDSLNSLYREFESRFQKLLPELESIYKKSEDRPKFSFFEGREAIREANSSVVEALPEFGCYFRISSGVHGPEHRTYFNSDYSKERESKSLERLIITSDANRKKDPYDPNRNVVAIPSKFDSFDDRISKVIFWDRVLVLDYVSETGFVIENERYARYEEKLFRLLFELLEKEERRNEKAS